MPFYILLKMQGNNKSKSLKWQPDYGCMSYFLFTFVCGTKRNKLYKKIKGEIHKGENVLFKNE